MVKAYHADETNLAERASAGGFAKQHLDRLGERALPRYLVCGYDDFCRLLVKRHGADYLRRPDGEPLAYVPAAAFVPLPVLPTQAPLPKPPLPVSAALRIDRLPGVQPAGIRDTIVRVLTVRPRQTLQELAESSGLPREQVRRSLSQWSGTYFRHSDRRWCVIANTPVIETAQPTA